MTKPIPPGSVVKLVTVTAATPGWRADKGRTFRIGYYSERDGLDCVWLVNDRGEYEQTVDQATIRAHFEVLKRSRETDLFGAHRTPLGPLSESSVIRKRVLRIRSQSDTARTLRLLRVPPARATTGKRRAAV